MSDKVSMEVPLECLQETVAIIRAGLNSYYTKQFNGTYNFTADGLQQAWNGLADWCVTHFDTNAGIRSDKVMVETELRAFLRVLRRALLMIVRYIEKKYDIRSQE